jgi:uncharacterized protein YqeY
MTDQAKPKNDSCLKKRIDDDLKEALRSRDSVALSVLRMLKSEIHYKEIERGSLLSDDDVISVLSTAIKKRKDSIQQFEKGGRDDLASKEQEELAVVTKYTPEQLGDEELSQIISQAIGEEDASGPSDLGRVMRLVMPKVRGRADGKRVNQMVFSRLQSISETE